VNRARIQEYVIVGLLAWGLPAAIILGPWAIAWTLLACLPVGLTSWWTRRHPTPPGPKLDPPIVPLVVLSLAYVAVDATLGRKKLELNMFLREGALEKAIEQINESVSQGRGVAELLGGLLAFLPFSLFDLSRRFRGAQGWNGRLTALLFAFYDAAISRGFALVAILSLVAGGRTTWRRVAVVGSAALAVFGVASFLRGDFREMSFSNPLFDAVGWPYLNLAFLHGGECGSASPASYGLEFVKKFVPAFLLPKTIFSFNIEMTRCIYPLFGDEVAAVSVFTWVGELVYYAPGWITALLAGSLLAIAAAGCDALLDRADLPSTRAFAGLMCIVLLRSRTQDVLSFLIFLALFLGGWIGLTTERMRRWLTRPVPAGAAGAPVKE
jgi:hypothetical protein